MTTIIIIVVLFEWTVTTVDHCFSLWNRVKILSVIIMLSQHPMTRGGMTQGRIGKPSPTPERAPGALLFCFSLPNMELQELPLQVYHSPLFRQSSTSLAMFFSSSFCQWELQEQCYRTFSIIPFPFLKWSSCICLFLVDNKTWLFHSFVWNATEQCKTVHWPQCECFTYSCANLWYILISHPCETAFLAYTY